MQSTTLSLGKGYVEMSTIDPETSQDIAEGIISAGGRYLEAQVNQYIIKISICLIIILIRFKELVLKPKKVMSFYWLVVNVPFLMNVNHVLNRLRKTLSS